jgi:S-formylglutathione hydrolase FrmB
MTVTNQFARLALATLAVLAAAVLLPPRSARAAAGQAVANAARGECFSIRSMVLGRAVAYCVVLPPGYDTDKTRRYPVLYYFHGLGGNERMLLQSGGFNLIEDLWLQNEMQPFLIVAPAGGSSFFIDSRDGRVPYEKFLIGELLPEIERRFRVDARRESRGVGGISMGGYGALHLAFRHPELFGSASAHSAALIEKPPMMNVGNSPEAGAFRIFGDVFGAPLDRAFWDRNNPLTLGRTADLSRQKIYFDCGTEDDYGFNAGAQALHDVLASRHIAHEFHLYPGGHDWTYFAAHLPASLEFHSHAFGAPPARAATSR